MKHIKSLLVLLTLTIFSSSAMAGWYVEPYLGYALGGKNENASSSVDYSAPVFGGRLGYSFLGVAVGAEGSLMSTEWEATGGATTDYKYTNLGVFFSYTAPILLRVWGTYHLSSSAENTDDASSSKGSKFTGGGYSVGAGFTGLPFVVLNLEYRVLKHDEFESASGTKTSLGGTTERDDSALILSVSLPLDF